MDFKEIYNGISNKMLNDFKISSQITQGTDKGTYRENSLRNFLENGKLPKKYTIGHGQIITRKNEISKSVDLVLYDNINSSPLLYNESTQIFPIESVYGIIECKSQLSKAKLIEGLENIKSVKNIAPNDTAIQKGIGVIATYKRPTPFGIIFAYSLSNNSLKSLLDNLIDWEKNNNPNVWPNLIVILNEGIIIHRDSSFNNKIKNKEIVNKTKPVSLAYKEDSLFNFYIILIDLCSNMHLGEFQLEDYFNLPDRFGNIYVKGSYKFTHSKTGKKVRLKIKFLKEINDYCNDSNKSNWVDVFKKMTGHFIGGLDEKKYLKKIAYLYNPNCYPGMQEVKEPYKKVNGRPVFIEDMCFPFIQLEINDKDIFLPSSYIKDDKLEETE